MTDQLAIHMEFNFGRAIRHRRTQAALTQEQLAKSMSHHGWSRSIVVRVESGQRTVAAAEVPDLANALGLDLLSLYGLAAAMCWAVG